ncbi:sporulation integral membrane protein YtvI [Paenibacillus sp. sptzw28]|uniref:sporulation integral membrane protein YtvI n=1 Tax=Paenibacillus sp. sptzw28 TaxID=715179 RepID=UPI001C6DDAD1|nr:sporulation integral membrane protein YtvI [Paenibacillus sp. sptzw28]QYR20392.1 sporulation integral membrane protein YtvI [Paenibacillus sp. sptzw28]
MDRAIWRRIGRALIVFLGIISLILAIIYLTPLVYPFIIGWVLAYAINPIVNGMNRKLKVPRWLGVAITLLLFVVSMLTIVSALVTRIVVEIIHLSKSLDSTIVWWRDQFERIIASPEIQGFIEKLNAFYQNNPNYQLTINTRISDTANMLAKTSSNIINDFLIGIVNLISSLPNMATITLVVLLAAFFIGKDWYRHVDKMGEWIPTGIRKTTTVVWNDLLKALFGYLRAQFIMISITMVVVTIGLLILGVNYAITIGMLIGLVDLLPYLGVGAAMIPWIAYTFIYGDLSLGIGLSVLYGVILVVRSMLEPKVLASSVGLAPLPTLIAMFVGLKLFGVLGLIIGPVSLVILSTIHRANVFRDLYWYVVRGAKAPPKSP